jgi:WD40 repeat protein/serine/threonine protein kinase
MNQTEAGEKVKEQDERKVGTPSLSPSESDDPRVIQALEEYAAALRDGRQPSRAEFQSRFPEIADALSECLEGLEFIQEAAPRLHESAAEPPAGISVSEDIQPHGSLGDFRILREIGRGGMGIVYEAEQISLDRRVALKILPFAAALDAKQLQRFKNEAQAAAHLHHQNIVPVYFVGCERGVHFYAMQFIEGQTLAAVIRELRQSAGKDNGGSRSEDCGSKGEDECATIQDRGPRDDTKPGGSVSSILYPSSSFFRTVAQLGVQAAEALEHAHQLGVIHRDIKPANLLVDAGGQLWITDFGLAHCQSQPGLTMSGDVVGTLRYMSPEQALAKRIPVDPRTDVYSLGVTLYELLTLEPAYNGRNREEVLRQIAFEEPCLPSRWNKAVPAELETIVLKAMAKSAEERYATAQELADDLERYLKDEPIRARRPTLVQRVKKWTRRHLPVVWTAGLSLVAMLILAVIGLAASNILITREKAQTDTAKEELERTLYYQRIALAEREWSANNLGRAEQLLEECRADLRHWEWHYLKRLRHKTLSPLHHDSMVLCVAYSPTGHCLASASQDGVIKVWDAQTGQPLWTSGAGQKLVFSVAFSPDGQRLASAGSDGSVKIWDVQAGKEILYWKAHTSPVSCVAFSPDGLRLASTCSSKHIVADPVAEQVKIWDAAAGKEIHTLEGHTLGVLSVAFSPDGRSLATAGQDRTVKVWDATTGQLLLTCHGHTGTVNAVAFSPGGRYLASVSGEWVTQANAEVILHDARTGEPRLTLRGHTGFLLSVAFSPDGRRIASAGMDKTVKLWDVATGLEALTLRGHESFIRAVAFSPDGRRLVSAGEDRTVRIWDATPLTEETAKDPLTLRGHGAGVFGVAYHPDGRRLATASADGSVKVWDAHTGEPRFTFRGRGGCFWSVAFSPDGRQLAAAGDFGELRLWDATTGQDLYAVPGLTSLVSRVTFSPNGRFFVSAGFDRTLRIWDATTGLSVHTILAHDFAITGLAISPESRYIASAGTDDTVKIWDANTGEMVERLEPPHPACPSSVAFRPDGQLLASASRDGTIKFWDSRTWQEKRVLRDPTGGVRSLAFSPDSRLLAWGSDDPTVKVWDTATSEIRSLRGHTSWVRWVAFSPNGQWIASASLDGTVKLWEVPFVPEAHGPAAGAPGLAP